MLKTTFLLISPTFPNTHGYNKVVRHTIFVDTMQSFLFISHFWQDKENKIVLQTDNNQKGCSWTTFAPNHKGTA